MESNEIQTGKSSPEAKRRRGRPRKSEEILMHKESSINPFSNLENPMEFIHHYRDMHYSEKEKLIKWGFTKNQLVCIKNVLLLDYPTLASFLHVTQRSLHLRKENDRLNPWINDRVGALLELYCYALEVFANPLDAREWLKSPTALLAGQSPLVMSCTHPGLLKTRELLYRIRLGQF
ncbi:antitoxin Xre/MbcA/ParS toxin-binding domain-containing protein [Chitinophaga alhagiae]|uniref:antitoxin Xre/MbcA/ParS toxin-binding domain-containing protein n=1 Tax=Chitinophaga alhagiae TaxID=2203219 RepID=UPI000E5A617F|nr:antitoxin Xre/MbcA/ParS toxin-binding domain-containing protein [Chitinophaga alhagiae]